ncbi:tyrosine-type recombinase/integrase [Actinopolyspora sp. H202]|uniref:tyrosine-type recombinase/integrase n=1 Tax=Actinopolyspora sp. H202 TaxID=1500456 RepID=UPI003EE48AF6
MQGWITGDPTRRIRRRPRTPDRTRSIGRAEVENLLIRTHLPIRERTLWRLLYETAARTEEILAVDVDELDLHNRRAKVRRKGGAADVIVGRTATDTGSRGSLRSPLACSGRGQLASSQAVAMDFSCHVARTS